MESPITSTGAHIDLDVMLNKSIQKRLVKYDNMYYYVFNYDEDVLCYNNIETRQYRMVIISYPENKLLSYSPPKLMGYNTFVELYPTISSNIQISEYIKGIMINLLYDDRCKTWRLISPSNENKTKIISKFKTALHINNLNTTPILEYLSKTQSYTFILKNNYVNSDENIDKFYLVSVYELKNNNVKYIPNTVYENDSFLKNIAGLIYFPRKYDLHCYNNLFDMKDNIDGYLLTDLNTGNSSKILNPDIMLRDTMSTINPYYTYEYLCVRRIDKLHEYNKIYRKTRNTRHIIHTEYERIITSIHNFYMNKYVFKTNPSIPDKYIRYLNFLHSNIYIPSLKKKNKEKITRNKVKIYLNLLNPTELLSLLYQ